MGYTDADITWIERRESLDALGFEEYQQFVDSKLWFDSRQNLLRHPYYHTCPLCAKLGTPKHAAHLHHKHYRDLSIIETIPNYVVPVCQPHHKIIHDISTERLISVEEATDNVFLAFRVPLCCPDAGRDIDEWENDALLELANTL